MNGGKRIVVEVRIGESLNPACEKLIKERREGEC